MRGDAVRPVLERARERGVEVLDVEPVLRQVIESGRASVDCLFRNKYYGWWLQLRIQNKSQRRC